MTVLILTACPAGLRGQLTRWLLEIAPGVFIGHVPARVRELLWTRVTDQVRRGRALLVHTTKGEQRLAFKVHGHDWTPTDFDGIQLMMRPLPEGAALTSGPLPVPQTPEARSLPPKNWSSAARRRRYGAASRRRRQSEE